MGIKKEQIAGGNYHYTRFTFKYFLESMKKLGLQNIELYGACPHIYVDDYTPQMTRDLKKQLDQYGINVVCYTPEQCVYPTNIAIEDDFIRKRSLEYFYRTIEQAEILEAPYVQVVGGRGYFDGDAGEAWKRSAESLRLITKKAESHGVTMVIEAASYKTSNVIHSTSAIVKMIKEIGSQNCKGMIDTNAIFLAGEDFEEAVASLGSDLRHMHFIDATQNDYCLIPGSGDLPMADYIDILGRYGYQGYLTPELWGGKYDLEPEDAMQRSIEFCYQFTK